MLKTHDWHFTGARDLFDAARRASHDAECIRLQLAEMKASAESVGGSGFEPRVRSTADPHRMESRAIDHVDREAALGDRMREDRDLMDLAEWVLYGRDDETGLSVLVPKWWCDVLWWRYLRDAKWARVGRAVGYSEQRCRQVAEAALDVVDSWGLVATMQGRPLNTVETWERDRLRGENH
jgi:hypothetical protein